MSNSLIPAAGPQEQVSQKTWNVLWTIEKWHREADLQSGLAPDEVLQVPDNGLLSGGINFLLNQIIGGSSGTYPYFSNANAYIKVGTGTTAFDANASDLAGGSTAEAAMNSTYPIVTNTGCAWQATFSSGSGNFAWEEIAVKNGSGAVSSTVKLLNRKVATMGTKASGAAWTVTFTITIA
jgi:subtilisin family serine protease